MGSRSRRERRALTRAVIGSPPTTMKKTGMTQMVVRKLTHRLILKDAPSRHTTQQVNVAKWLRRVRRHQSALGHPTLDPTEKAPKQPKIVHTKSRKALPKIKVDVLVAST